jgi:mono/diheme cytochrome c family protein
MNRSARFLVSMPLSLGLLAFGATLASAADGDALYAANCAKCHGADGRAQTPVGKAMKAASLVDPKWASKDSTDALITAFHANPKHKAVAGKVSDDDLKAIAVHVQALAAAGK